MTKREIIEIIEGYAPILTADENDVEKIGLQVGCLDGECSGVMTCLDCTHSVIEQAVAAGCNLVLSHHPTIFNKLQKIDTAQSLGKTIECAIANGITVYTAHTNLDKSECGTNATIVKLLGGKVTSTEGCLFFAELQPILVRELAMRIAKVLDDNSVRTVSDLDRVVTSICVCSGGGASEDAVNSAMKKAEVIITGDIPHHVYMYAEENGFPLIEFSHYSSEIIACDCFANMLDGAQVQIIKANQHRPFRMLEEI